MKSYVVIGLGRFGAEIAAKLYACGEEVLAVDVDEQIVDKIADRVTRAVQTFLVDGKFYTLFSLLFGMGFSIQLANAEGKLKTFYRRMAVLLLIGLLHLFFLWSGDILMLYAVCGMFLPLFRKLSTRSILTAAGVFHRASVFLVHHEPF